MKKIYTIIFVSCLAAISFSSCSDWLDVRPADEIKEEYLFETGNGYRTALNGIYRSELYDNHFLSQTNILPLSHPQVSRPASHYKN